MYVQVRFERMLFRATRGNCYVRFSALSGKAVDATGNHIAKVTTFIHIFIDIVFVDIDIDVDYVD